MSQSTPPCSHCSECRTQQNIERNLTDINTKMTSIMNVLHAFCNSWQTAIGAATPTAPAALQDDEGFRSDSGRSTKGSGSRKKRTHSTGGDSEKAVKAQKSDDGVERPPTKRSSSRIKAPPKKLLVAEMTEESPTETPSTPKTSVPASLTPSPSKSPTVVAAAAVEVQPCLEEEQNQCEAAEEGIDAAKLTENAEETEWTLKEAREEKKEDDEEDGVKILVVQEEVPIKDTNPDSETSVSDEPPKETGDGLLQTLHLQKSPNKRKSTDPQRLGGEKKKKNPFFLLEQQKKRGQPITAPTEQQIMKEILLFPGKAVSANCLTRFGPTGTLRRLGYFTTDQAKSDIERLCNEGLLTLVITNELPNISELPSAAKRNVYRKLPVESEKLDKLLEKYGISRDRYTVAYHASSCGELKYLNDYL